ncbi:MAG: DNA-directed RNA polymerase subunit alpha [Bacillota bacterium]
MSETKKPKIEVNGIDETNTYGQFVWEPLPRGYGITLGNSLRRILLSGLPGSAVNAIRIDGVLHEFSTIPGVREDVTDMILNIKSLRLKAEDDEAFELRIERNTAGAVTGADVICPEGIKVLNQDLYIATLEKGAQLNMSMSVTRGTGYVSADRNKKVDQPIGEIPIDSIYTPVLRVKCEVTDTRVGNITNYDKLTVDVWTDGSISPRNAVGRSAEILVDYMQQVTSLAGIPPKKAPDDEDNRLGRDNCPRVSIDEVEFSVRARNCLIRIGIKFMDELGNLSEQDLGNIKNAGRKTIDEIKDKAQQYGINFKAKSED